jgi:hypothetical protein
MKVTTRLSYLLAIVFLIVYIFAIVGTYLWAGLARQRCYDTHTGVVSNPDTICTMGSSPTPWTPSLVQGRGVPTGAKACPDGQACLALFSGTRQGNNFDNLSASYSTWIQFITLQGWSSIMETMQSAYSPYAGVVFLAMLALVPLYVLLLFQALLLHTMAELRQQEVERLKWRIKERATLRTKDDCLRRWIDLTALERVVSENAAVAAYIDRSTHPDNHPALDHAGTEGEGEEEGRAVATGGPQPNHEEDISIFREFLLFRRVSYLWYLKVRPARPGPGHVPATRGCPAGPAQRDPPGSEGPCV